MRINYATFAWHTLRSAIVTDGAWITRE